MHDIALALSIVSSLLIIIYLVGLIFGGRKKQDDLTITVSGRIVTRTIHQFEGCSNATNTASGTQSTGRVVEGDIVDAKVLQSKVADILKNVK
ncbi:MAG: hypothetical protein ACOYBQ_09595 [Fluviibacter sp.]